MKQLVYLPTVLLDVDIDGVGVFWKVVVSEIINKFNYGLIIQEQDN